MKKDAAAAKKAIKKSGGEQVKQIKADVQTADTIAAVDVKTYVSGLRDSMQGALDGIKAGIEKKRGKGDKDEETKIDDKPAKPNKPQRKANLLASLWSDAPDEKGAAAKLLASVFDGTLFAQ